MGRISVPTDAELLDLAGPLRVLTNQALGTAGLGEKAIRLRVGQGRLQHLWRPVYLVGATPAEPLSLARAATLSCPGFVSSEWAGLVHRFMPEPQLPVHVLIVKGSREGRRGKVVVHRSTIIGEGDLGAVGEIPVTSAARALLDIGTHATLARLEALVAEAQVARAVTPAELHELVGRAGRHPGAKKLRLVISESPGLTLSEAERILRRILREADLPQPLTNYRIGAYRADFAWPQTC